MPVSASSGQQSIRARRRAVRAWCLYDWANSAFVTTVMAALFPPFYRSLATGAGLPAHQATAYWGYTVSAALLLVAVIAPVLGAVADISATKKRFMLAFATLGVLATLFFVSIRPGQWRLASFLFILGNIGFAGANVFYESFLPHVAAPGELDRVSTRAYALGYVGGGLLLVVNLMWVTMPQRFGIPDVTRAVHLSFVSVALWWALFTLPFARHVSEPPSRGGRRIGTGSALAGGFSRLAETLRHIRQYRQLTLFLIAFWIYNDGIGTIIKMATAYGDEIGIQVSDMMLALVITQFVGIPFSFGFGALAGRIGTKIAIILSLVVYTGISVAAYFMTTALHFYLLAFMVGTVQGGSQALSRSLYGSMVPKSRSAEFFGFYSTSAKFAGIFGPLLFALVSQITGQSRWSIVSLIVFFIAGIFLLLRVDVEEGRRVAEAVERAERPSRNPARHRCVSCHEPPSASR